MKFFLLATILFLLFSCSENSISISAKEIAQNSLILDSHIDVPYRLWNQSLEGFEIDDISGLTGGDFDFIRAKKGIQNFVK